MKNKTGAKLIVTVRSPKGTNELETISVYDCCSNSSWTEDKIKARGANNFKSLQDLQETLNWNLNGNSAKYKFKWGQSGKQSSEGLAYIFD